METTDRHAAKDLCRRNRGARRGCEGDFRRAVQGAERRPTGQDAASAGARGRGGAGDDGPALQQTSTETELSFVPLLALHTRQGFYADPIYGGNRDRIGWKVIGFPGPASLLEVFTGRYSALPWFAEGEEQKYREANGGA